VRAWPSSECLMDDPLAPAPQVARQGHRAPDARSRLKAGAPSSYRLAVEADFVGIPQVRPGFPAS